jgi:hypothetical protein
MRLYLVAYQTHQAEFLGAAIVEAFDQIEARERAPDTSRTGLKITVGTKAGSRH